MSAFVYLGLGSNLGDRESNLAQALAMLVEKVRLEKYSSIYETEPVGYSEQPDFLNMVCSGSTDLDPFDLLTFVKEIEKGLGRVPSFPNAPRPIDIDILFYDDQIIRSESLTIPHSRIAERAFVLVPLSEIAPKLIHPENGKHVEELLSEITNTYEIRKYKDVSSIGQAAL